MTDHIKAPWKLKGDDGKFLNCGLWGVENEGDGSYGWFPIHDAKGKVVCLMVYSGPSEKPCAERAALIVRAVNSHDALVEALEAALKRLGFADKHIDCTFEIELIRAALTAAKPTQG